MWIELNEDTDVTELLGIKKWEAPIPAQLSGRVRGNFPTAVPKTDQERAQNLKKDIARWAEDMVQWEVTEKLDGSSCTMYLDMDSVLHVCSRNLDLIQDENNSFWKVAIAYNIHERMISAGLYNVALQGELVGEGVQGNPYKLTGQDFYLFDIYDVNGGKYFDPEKRRDTCQFLGLKHAPVIATDYVINDSVEGLLLKAEAKSALNTDTEREGLVFKTSDNSFKAISNLFLIKTGN